MKFTLQKTTKTLKEHDLLVVGAFSAKTGTKKASTKKSPKAVLDLGSTIKELDSQFSGHLMSSAAEEGFIGDESQIFVTNTLGKSNTKAIAFIGLGDAHLQTIDLFRRTAGDAFKLGHKKHVKSLGLVIPEKTTVPLFDVIQAIAEGIRLASYQFDRYLTKGKLEIYLKEVHIYLSSEPTVEQKSALTHAHALSDGIFLARDLINEGPMELNPQKFAEHATKIAHDCELGIDILDEKKLKRERMNLMLAVASAAQPFSPPRLIRLHYKPKKPSKQKVALVGKGVTFDSGGLDIKTTEGMLDMKVDMSGAACVLGAMRAIAKLEPKVEVFGYMACVENGVGPHAYHPGDILVSRKGLSVEINNTDAEGRLILADTFTYATDKDKPDIIIDIATLTGACMVALGAKTSGLFTNDDQLHDAIYQAGIAAGESFWRLPLNAALKEVLKSTIADIKNTGDRYGGAITAALFLQEFIEEGIKWAHLDIAGPATNNKPHAYNPIGGVGFGVRTLTSFLMGMG